MNLQSGRRRRTRTELALTIGWWAYFWVLESSDQGNIKIAIEKDKGDHIEEAFVQDLSFELHENLISKLEKIKSGELNSTLKEAMKLFGFHKPNTFLTPIPIADEKQRGINSNTEQKIAILKSMSQEVTFILGSTWNWKNKDTRLYP